MAPERAHSEDLEPDHRAEPGRALIRGRIASLLEVGTGFHPELSGGKISFSTARSSA